jgi:hypothetical protein
MVRYMLCLKGGSMIFFDLKRDAFRKAASTAEERALEKTLNRLDPADQEHIARRLRADRLQRGTLRVAVACAAAFVLVALFSGFLASGPGADGSDGSLVASTVIARGLASAPRSEDARDCSMQAVRWLLALPDVEDARVSREALKDVARLIDHARNNHADAHAALLRLSGHHDGSVRRAAILHGRSIGFAPPAGVGAGDDPRVGDQR